MARVYKVGVIGCGDYLKIMSSGLKASKRIELTHFFDVNTKRAADCARAFNGQAVGSSDELLADKDIDMLVMFVPPWVRRQLLCQAVAAGKHVLTTKPLAPNTAECQKMIRAAQQSKMKVGVIYNRTSNSAVETMKQIFVRGSIGKLALYRQDWIHHYPQWNNWALDPQKNGGPFMDAMIHNLNIVRYLMGRSATVGTMFSDRHSHPQLTCADTESLKLDFTEHGSAHLFITWAADLAVYSTKGNQREHIDWCYGVTDQGWRITMTKKMVKM
ncbi:MAG: Gfo/Idh/MocA family oxidoreductase [Phycisphaerales bacterium]|nr:Gfo/Idh/MocA family oxidoreductase [Phycisphaerales bacterium]